MSMEPPSLNYALVQRLDAVLGTTMASQSSQAGHPTHGPSSTNSVPASTSTTLGLAARLILALLTRYPDAPPAIRGAQALWPQPASTPLSTQALRQALTQSGLFYESHLAQLASGRWSLADIRQEPQARWTTPNSANLAGTPDAHADGALLMRQQLDVLANQAIAWQGQAWPGTDMHWEVRRHAAAAPDASDTSDTHWHTRITLDLPRLGQVEARIALAGQHVIMHLLAPSSAVALNASTDDLRRSLAQAGLALGQISVASRDSGPEAANP